MKPASSFKKGHQYFILNKLGEPTLESDPILLMKWRKENSKDFSIRNDIDEYTIATCFVGVKQSPASAPINWVTTIYGPHDFTYEFGQTNTFSKANKIHRQGISYVKNIIENKNKNIAELNISILA